MAENQKFLQDQPMEGIERLFNVVTKQLSLVMITLSDDENPFAIFETLNERGLRLEESDLIRNYVFMQLPLQEQDQFDAEEWTPLEKIFEKTDQYESINLTKFYRDYLMHGGEYIKKNEIYIRFKKHFVSSGEKPQELVKDLKRYGKFFSFILRPGTVDERPIAEALKRIGYLDVGTSYPVLLFLYDQYENRALRQDLSSRRY